MIQENTFLEPPFKGDPMLIRTQSKFLSADAGGSGGGDAPKTTPKSSSKPRDGFVACTLGLHHGPHGVFSRIVNVAGRVALTAGAVVGTIRLFSKTEDDIQLPDAAGAYEPR